MVTVPTPSFSVVRLREGHSISTAQQRTSKPALVFGFASGPEGDRRATIAGKAVLTYGSATHVVKRAATW